MSPQYAGMPEDTQNKRTDPCGCRKVYIGPTAHSGPCWIVLRPCTEHEEAS